ncbi:MAG TPA: two-component regulator propeller domain-containing protein, partial [Flavisolibacter sp.]|nr:two-component regulator propeller domain-containing protein [Flavisolibacter sp.]
MAAKAQEKDIVTIPGLPSHEAYDLLKDSKGYLWVGHEFGVSRYDGSLTITLHHPRQSSLSMTHLVEDKRGRIWCHNFSGQIFYIENLQLHLLEQYKSQEELGYPKIALCGDELVASSSKGLFVYNTLTDQSRYMPIHGGTTALTNLGNKVVAVGDKGWYSYEADKPIQQLSSDSQLTKKELIALPVANLRDTFFVFSNALGSFFKLTLENNKIKVLEEKKVSSFVNTLSIQGRKVWVNTKEYSFTDDGQDSIKGMNLSDVLVDPAGNRWISSLRRGLCVQYNVQPLKKFSHPLLTEGDAIRKITTEGNELFLGTISGKLYRLNAAGSLRYIVSLPQAAGAVEQIAFAGRGQLLLGGSSGLYFYDLQTSTLRQMPVPPTVKDMV